MIYEIRKECETKSALNWKGCFTGIDLSYPEVVRQPSWVLQSASFDRPESSLLDAEPNAEGIYGWSLIQPGWNAYHKGKQQEAKELWRKAIEKNPENIHLMRVINTYSPELLRQKRISRLGKPWGSRIAVVVPGELRCWQNSKAFFETIGHHADIFTCTSQAFADAAKQIAGNNIKIVIEEPKQSVGAVQQWHKLAQTLSMVRSREKQKGQKYTHIIKLRSDFYHVQPKHLLYDLVCADGLICASDKVFGGRRELMMLFEGFYAAIRGWFDQREETYWPINVETILNSDDSSKWYGMNFPKELVGEPSTVDELRTVLSKGKIDLTRGLQEWKPTQNTKTHENYMKQLHRLIPGHPRFASEICFARFLNFNGIHTHNTASLLGFLRTDRHVE